MIRTLLVPEDAPPDRLDRFLAATWPDLSRSRLQALIRQGAVTVDGVATLDPSMKAGPGLSIALDEPPPIEAVPKPEAIPLSIVFEDDEVIVVDKPAGLVVHPGAGNPTGTLVNALLHHCRGSLSGIGGVERPGIVHRIDRDTSGLLVVAKTDRAHKSLSAQFADHGRTGEMRRAYLALAWGVPDPTRGTVDAAIARSQANREKMTVAASGRHAVTHYETEETFGDEPIASLLRCTLETGRTHQIRVHLAHLRHPLVGDETYGAGFRTKIARLPDETRAAVEAFRRQALHAALLQFEHPASGEVLCFESDLPDDFATVLERFRSL